MGILAMPLGWLSPEADLWKCTYESHLCTADKIIEKYKINEEDYPLLDSDEILLKRGWVKLFKTIYGEMQYNFAWNRQLTEPQKIFIKSILNKKFDFPINNETKNALKKEIEYKED